MAPAGSGPLAQVAVAIGAGLWTIAVVGHAWLSDDALITLRSVANATVGNGATFNALELVQSYTHPLWFAVLVAANRILLAPIHWALLLNMAAALIMGAMLIRAAGRHRLLAAAVAAAAASLPAIVEWTSSGLENSLSMLLTVLLLRAVARPGRSGSPLVIGVLAGALVLNRLDLALIAGPLLLTWVVGQGLRRGATAVLVAAVPLAGWTVWAVRYYGTVLPNTYYAKLNVDIPWYELMLQGVSYLRLTSVRQPLALLVLVLATVVLTRPHAALTARLRAAVLAAMVLYAAYIVRIGGDFMEGRFLGVILALALMAIVISCRDHPSGETTSEPPDAEAAVISRAVPWVLAGGIVLALVGGSVPWTRSGLEGSQWDFRSPGYGGIADERGFYVDLGYSLWSGQELAALESALRGFGRVDAPPTEFRVACGGLGRKGVEAGPTVHLIDPCGLVDPVLARVPFVSDGFRWRIGHFQRDVPEGYELALQLGDGRWIQDDAVRSIFERIHPSIRRELGG